MSEKIYMRLGKELGIAGERVARAVALFDEGNTVPFIARYRKEMTGGLTDEELRLLHDKLGQYRNLEQRRGEVLRLIDVQGALTPELARQVAEAATVTELDDIYRPYRPKKKTRASAAREKGLEPLALALLGEDVDPPEEASRYVDAEKDLPDRAAVLGGASDIIAEMISDHTGVRGKLRDLYRRLTVVEVSKKKGAVDETYDQYAGYSEPLPKIKSHRVLAVNRGVKEKVLDLKLVLPEDAVLRVIEGEFASSAQNEACRVLVCAAGADSYRRLIHPSLERETWQELLERAVTGALAVFRENLKKRLLVPPVRGQKVMGWDPGFRTGCKLACVSETGELLSTAAVFPTAPRSDREGAAAKVLELVEKHAVGVIALGNGTASRESEEFISALIAEHNLGVQYTIVNEAGASVYSASPAAGKEFPGLDVAERSAVSIARRLQDPLAELVKIDPRAIGVGQYQHDMPPAELGSALEGTVESCVNSVGVDLNSASAALLSYVAGINSRVADNIVALRSEKGSFGSREDLLAVSGLGPKAFKQCAGFLRLFESDNYLERSAVHPESYALALKVIEALALSPGNLGRPGQVPAPRNGDAAALAARLNAGEPTVRDIWEELRRPGRDPRDTLPPPVFMKAVTALEDIAPGMTLTGIVRNIVDFGAFVDIGVHRDGLVHISEIADRYVRHPLEVLQIEEAVKVKVLSVDRERGRISLSIRQAGRDEPPAAG